MAETGDTFKAIVNGLLRFALGSHAAAMSGTVPARKFSTPVFKGGQILAGEVSSTAELLALAESFFSQTATQSEIRHPPPQP